MNVLVRKDNQLEANETVSLRIDSLEVGGVPFDGIVTGTAVAVPV